MRHFLFAPAAPPLSLDDVLKQMDREQGQFQSLTASIERTKVTVVVNDRSTESGQIEVRRDGKMRIDLTSPDQKTILRDGDHIYVYTPKIRRVEEYDLGKHRDLVDQLLLLGFGTSGDSLKKSYLITLQGEESLNGQKVVHLELTPRADDVRKQISKIDLWLNEGNWLPAQQQLLRDRIGRLLDRSVFECGAKRGHPRCALPSRHGQRASLGSSPRIEL